MKSIGKLALAALMAVLILTAATMSRPTQSAQASCETVTNGTQSTCLQYGCDSTSTPGFNASLCYQFPGWSSTAYNSTSSLYCTYGTASYNATL